MHALRAGAGVLCGALACCAPDEGEGRTLELLDFRQAQKGVVALNEELVFHFSSDLDRASVTRESVRITGTDDDPVAGDFAVRGSTLLFRPTLPRLADLSDGGLQPGVAYDVELVGFPRPDGLRDRDGAVLGASFRSRFRTVAREGAAPLFADPFLQQPSFLTPRARRIGPLDPIELVYDEALDPTTLDPADFVLFSYQDEENIPLRLELTRNERDGAVLWLRPLSTDVSIDGLRALEEGRYFLRYEREARLATLGGRPVQKRWGPRPLEIFVSEPRLETWDEPFDTTAYRGREALEEADGTAAWTGDGAVRIRYPLEAGSGRDGRVSTWPGDGPDPADVHAARLSLSAGESWDLTPLEGLIVLRSQGALEIAGTLRRTVRPDTEPLAESLRGPDRRFLADAGSLAAWLERAREDGHDWTVLIAGGDLRVSGQIEIDGPLLLIAGGWIRVAGRVEAAEVWKSPEGGENVVAAETVRVAPFRWSAPEENPLVLPLRFAVLSSPLRPEDGVLRWEGASVEGVAGHGKKRVRFLGLRDLGPSQAELFGPLDDPALLGDCPAVRFLVELEVDPADGPWDPPRVDRVALEWSAPARPRAEGQ